MMKRNITATLLAFLFHVNAAFAGENCAKILRDSVAAPSEIVKGMADYKAAMDAGYAACMVSYPKEFAPLLQVNNFMQSNMSAELEKARETLFYFIDSPSSKKTEKACENESGAKETLKKELGALLDGQYKKSYSRRHRIMSKAGLVTEDQDSCLIVLDMVRKYEEYYDDYRQLHHVLYESSKKQTGQTKNAPSRSDFGAFEKTRNRLAGEIRK